MQSIDYVLQQMLRYRYIYQWTGALSVLYRWIYQWFDALSVLYQWIHWCFCDLSVLYRRKHWFTSEYTGIQQMKYYMNLYFESCLLEFKWCLKWILLQMRTFREHQVWSDDPASWNLPSRPSNFDWNRNEIWPYIDWNSLYTSA